MDWEILGKLSLEQNCEILKYFVLDWIKSGYLPKIKQNHIFFFLGEKKSPFFISQSVCIRNSHVNSICLNFSMPFENKFSLLFQLSAISCACDLACDMVNVLPCSLVHESKNR